jgi:hypothetical protein
MSTKSKLYRITLFLAIIVGVSCACYGVLSVADQYYRAQNKLNVCIESAQGWEACRKIKPEFYEANTDTVSTSMKNLDEAQNNFWVKLPKSRLVGLYVLVGLTGAVGGCLISWIVFWFSGMAIYESLRWLALACCGHSGQRKNLHYQHPG